MDDACGSNPPRPSWLLVSSHGLVLFFVATNPDATISEISRSLSLTERRVVAIVRDLAAAGLIEVRREGRRNSYRLVPDAHFRHPTMAHVRIVEFVRVLEGDGTSAAEPSVL